MKRSRSKKKLKESSDRKARRGSHLGRSFENDIKDLLYGMERKGMIYTFTYNKPYSKEDSQGKDFRITRVIKTGLIERCFGVTISRESHKKAILKHPKVPQFYWPYGKTNPETMEKRILELF